MGLPVVRALAVVAVRRRPPRRPGAPPGRPRPDPVAPGAPALRGGGVVVFEGAGHHAGCGGALRGGVLRELRPPRDRPDAREGGVGVSAGGPARRPARRGSSPAADVPVVGRARRDGRVRGAHGPRGRRDRDRRDRRGRRAGVEAFHGASRRRPRRAVAPARRRLQVGPPGRRPRRRLRPRPSRRRRRTRRRVRAGGHDRGPRRRRRAGSRGRRGVPARGWPQPLAGDRPPARV